MLVAEAEGDYVHIIGHVAPLYPDCYEEWGHQFSRIVTRFGHQSSRIVTTSVLEDSYQV